VRVSTYCCGEMANGVCSCADVQTSFHSEADLKIFLHHLQKDRGKSCRISDPSETRFARLHSCTGDNLNQTIRAIGYRKRRRSARCVRVRLTSGNPRRSYGGKVRQSSTDLRQSPTELWQVWRSSGMGRFDEVCAEFVTKLVQKLDKLGMFGD
jgi:hypothetical protein